MDKATLEERAKQAQREYARKWRANNPEKVKAAQARYWQRKAEQMAAEEEINEMQENEKV